MLKEEKNKKRRKPGLIQETEEEGGGSVMQSGFWEGQHNVGGAQDGTEGKAERGQQWKAIWAD